MASAARIPPARPAWTDRHCAALCCAATRTGSTASATDVSRSLHLRDIFAAVEPGTDVVLKARLRYDAFALVLPYVNTEAMQVFLDRLAATIDDAIVDAAVTACDGLAAETRRLTMLASHPWLLQVIHQTRWNHLIARLPKGSVRILWPQAMTQLAA